MGVKTGAVHARFYRGAAGVALRRGVRARRKEARARHRQRLRINTSTRCRRRGPTRRATRTCCAKKASRSRIATTSGSSTCKAAVGEFVEKIEPGDTAVFVYSGHGWSDGAHNYLVGVDAPDRASQERLTRLSLPIRNGATGVLDDFERKGAALKVAIIDACRDNPFQPPPGQKGYGLARGLRPEGVEGSFVVYSAGEGQSAMDRLSEADADPNSVFTRAFLPLLRADLPLLDAIKIARSASTRSPAPPITTRRRPITTRCADAPASPASARRRGASSASDDVVAAIIDAQTSPETLAGMIAKLPEGPLKERAKKKLAALRESQVANLSVAPPIPAPTKSPAARSYKLPEGAQLVPQLDHSSQVDFVRFSPDGARIASGSGTIRSSSGTRRAAVCCAPSRGIRRGVWSVAFSPDGARIASGSGDNTIKLWDAASGRLLRTFEGHSNSVDVSRVLAGRRPHRVGECADNTIKLWDAASGRLLRTFEGIPTRVRSVAFSPDGARIASGSCGQDDQALGRGERPSAAHLRGAFWPCSVGRVLAGRRPHRVGELRQDDQALGRGERPSAADL